MYKIERTHSGRAEWKIRAKCARVAFSFLFRSCLVFLVPSAVFLLQCIIPLSLLIACDCAADDDHSEAKVGLASVSYVTDCVCAVQWQSTSSTWFVLCRDGGEEVWQWDRVESITSHSLIPFPLQVAFSCYFSVNTAECAPEEEFTGEYGCQTICIFVCQFWAALQAVPPVNVILQ